MLLAPVSKLARALLMLGGRRVSLGVIAFACAAIGLRATDPVYTFSHLAGPVGGAGIADGTGAEARFTFPYGVAVDTGGNIYVADTGNSTLRRITPGGVVTTFAGAVAQSGSTDGSLSATRFDRPRRLAFDSAGNLYVADTGNHTIRKITASGTVTTFAGSAGQAGSDDGTGTGAQFRGPQGLAIDSGGNVYVADTGNHTIRKITSIGVVTTLAGSAGQKGSTNGTGVAALFSSPADVAVDGSANVYVADRDNHVIRKITPGGAVTILAGVAGTIRFEQGTGGPAGFQYPTGVAVDSQGNVLVADRGNSSIRLVTPAGAISTLVGGQQPGSRDGIFVGMTDSAFVFRYPTGITIDASGNVFVADERNHTIRKIVRVNAGTVTVSTIAGTATDANYADGTGSSAYFNWPYGITVDRTGNAYVADTANFVIRKITPAGVVSTFAGVRSLMGAHVDGPGSAARFTWLNGAAVDGSGNVYVADGNTVRKITPSGEVSTLAGSPTAGGNVDGVGASARLSTRGNPAVDSAGNIYLAQGSTIRKITPAGSVTTFAGAANESGGADGVAGAARFSGGWGMAVDSSDNLYVADWGNHTIRKITPAGLVTTLAGRAGESGSVDGSGNAARFNQPTSVGVDSAGYVFVTDTGNHTIRRITPSGAVTTIGGVPTFPGKNDGTGAAVRFDTPIGIAVDSAGDVYVADTWNNVIRKGSVEKAMAVITWVAPEPIPYGTPLSVSQLNATANISGEFTYTPAIGAVPDPGNHTLRVVFSPDDGVHYLGASAEVGLLVLPPPSSQTGAAGSTVTITAYFPSIARAGYRWRRNGVALEVEQPSSWVVTVKEVSPVDAGIYTAEAISFGYATGVMSAPAILGVTTADKVIGDGTELAETRNKVHPNGNVFDQVLLTGTAEAITADHALNQITRTSFIDLDGDIVQVEFSGPGTLSLVLDTPSGPAAPANYNQPTVQYMKGHAGIVIAGATEQTNVSVFTVGRATAFDPTGIYDITKAISATNDPTRNGSSLFAGHASTNYDGIADIAFIAILSTDGKFGGLRTSNAHYFASKGCTGIYAPGVEFTGPVFIGDITAFDDATPVIRLGSAMDVRITGGDLFQANDQPVQINGIAQLKFTAGTDSHGRSLPGVPNWAILQQNGVDVTAQVVVGP